MGRAGFAALGATASLPSSAKRVPGIHCWASQQWHPKKTFIEVLLSLLQGFLKLPASPVIADS